MFTLTSEPASDLVSLHAPDRAYARPTMRLWQVCAAACDFFFQRVTMFGSGGSHITAVHAWDPTDQSALRPGDRGVREHRSANAVVAAAAKLLGQQSPRDANMDEAGILWDWQLRKLTDSDYERLCVPIGLKAAIRHVLDSDESRDAPSEGQQTIVELLPGELRRFLLLREQDGSLPLPVSRLEVVFYAMLLNSSVSAHARPFAHAHARTHARTQARTHEHTHARIHP